MSSVVQFLWMAGRKSSGSHLGTGIGDESRWRGLVCELIAAEIGEPQNFGHFHVVDFVGGVRGVVVVGMESREPPKSRDVFQNKGKLVAAEENVESGFVIEAVIEDKYAKKEIFKTLDRVCPDRAILASNTSYLDIFKFVETRRPDKVLITHWFAPPHIVPLVEIVHGSQTSSETIQAIKALMIKVGKMPIVISKFLPGFIANCLQSALTREVLSGTLRAIESPSADLSSKWKHVLRIGK